MLPQSELNFRHPPALLWRKASLQDFGTVTLAIVGLDAPRWGTCCALQVTEKKDSGTLAIVGLDAPRWGTCCALPVTEDKTQGPWPSRGLISS